MNREIDKRFILFTDPLPAQGRPELQQHDDDKTVPVRLRVLLQELV